jgi:membrane protein implicated in regulation of membrane protease activity
MQIVLLSCLAADAVGLSAVLGGTVLVWLLDVHLCFVLVSALALLLLDPKAACTIAGLLFLGLRILVLVVGHRLRRQCLHPHFLARYRPIQH